MRTGPPRFAALLMVAAVVATLAAPAFAALTSLLDVGAAEVSFDRADAALKSSVNALSNNPADLVSLNFDNWASTFKTRVNELFVQTTRVDEEYAFLAEERDPDLRCAYNEFALNGVDKRHGYSSLRDELTALRTQLDNEAATLMGVEHDLQTRLTNASLSGGKTAPWLGQIKRVRDVIGVLMLNDVAILRKSEAAARSALEARGHLQGFQCPGYAAVATPTPTPKPKPQLTPAPTPKPAATPKPGSTPPPPTTPCSGKWQWWPGFGWRCVS